VLLGLLVATVAHATPAVPALYLQWDAPQACPDRAWMLLEVKRLRGALDVLEHSRDALLAARATVTSAGESWRVEIDTLTRGVPGHRSLSSDTCQRAGESAAVVLSLALSNAIAQPEPPAAPAEPPAVSAAAAPPEPLAAPLTLAMSLVGGGRAGPLPSFTPNAGLSFELITRVARVELTVFTPAPSQRVGTGARAVDLWVPLTGELDLAVPIVRARVQLDFATDLAAAYVAGNGVGPSRPSSGAAGWLAVEGGAVLHLGLWRSLSLRADARVGFGFTRPVFTVDGTSVYDTPVLTGRVGAGVEWLF
jgi:hypothetical protein